MTNPIPPALRIPTLLLAYSILPLGGSVYRLAWFANGAEAGSDPRLADIAAMPGPLLVHILFGCTFAVLGAFQFSDPIRRHRPRTHRALGRLVVISGVLTGLTAALAPFLYTPAPDISALGNGLRVTFGLMLAAALIHGVALAMQGQLVQHRVWMMRAYAIGLFGNTQTVLLIGLSLAMVPITPGLTAICAALGFLINLAVVERLRPAVRTPSHLIMQGVPR